MKINNLTAYAIQTPVNPQDYLLGSRDADGVTKNYRIGAISDFVLGQIGMQPNTGLISVESIITTDNDIAVNNVVYQINGEIFGDPDPISQTLTITPASEGMYRTDIIVGDITGTLDIVMGDESEENPVQPTLQPGQALISVVNIFGETIAPIIPPYDDLLLKSSEGAQLFYNSGELLNYVWGAKNTYRWMNLSGFNLVLRSMQITVATEEYLYDGRLLTIINAGAGYIEIRHDGPGLPFYLPYGRSIYLLPNEIAVFKYAAVNLGLELVSINTSYARNGKAAITTGGSDQNTLQSDLLLGAVTIDAIAGDNQYITLLDEAYPGFAFDSATGTITCTDPFFYANTKYTIFYNSIP